MGIFSKRKLNQQQKVLTEQFKMLQGYSPIYSSYEGGLYEMALTRSCIDKIATQCSKLNPIIYGKSRNYKRIQALLQSKPNRIMTTQQFLYRLFSILLVENNAYIIPIYHSDYDDIVVGYYPVRSTGSKIVLNGDKEFLVYKIQNTDYAIEYERVGHLRRFYYKKEYNGESNYALNSTMDLIHTQEQGIKEGIKSGAMIRFLAKLGVVQNQDAIKLEQKRLKEEQLGVENNGGVLIFDNKYSDVKQVDSKPFIVDKDNMELIKKNVFDYFHMSEEILQNTASEDQWNMFYEDVIEPLAIQLSQVLTDMIILPKDLEKDSKVVMESTKLQFVSNNTKLNVSQQLFDRGILTTNQVMDIWNLPHVPEEEDKRYIRKEYAEVNSLNKEEETNEESKGEETGTEDSGREETGSTNQEDTNV